MKNGFRIVSGLSVALVVGCGSNPQSGVDEHGNAISARVRVVDADGLPKANVEVVVRPSQWLPGEALDSLGAVPNAFRARTDVDGFCSISGLRKDAYALRAGDSLRAAVASLVWREGVNGLQVGLDSVGSLTGFVPSAAPGVQVGIQGLGQATHTDSAGMFVLPFVPQGTHRVVVGRVGNGTLLPQVEVHPGRLTDLGEVPFDSLRAQEVLASGVVAERLLAPIIQPDAGVYLDSVRVRAWSVLASDSLYVSFDGSKWVPWVERTIKGNSCLQFKSVRASAIYFPIRSVCYTIFH